MANKKSERTSKKVASTAAKLLNDPNSSADVKSVAASALTQAEDFAAPEPDTQKFNLLVGVNFRADGDEHETRIEPGVIEAGILPPAFEQILREKGKLVDVK